MGDYLKLFKTQGEYDAATDKSTVGHIVDDVKIVNYVDPYNGYCYVDLGLPSGTKWACYNVGASSETEFGNYYQYGKGAAQFSETSGQSDYAGTENPLATSADTAAQVMGGSWHMPTEAQMRELTAKTNYTWVTINGVKGRKFTSRTDATKYLFFPAAGFFYSGGQSGVGVLGSYQSSSLGNSNKAYYLSFSNASMGVYTSAARYGYNVRGVVG